MLKADVVNPHLQNPLTVSHAWKQHSKAQGPITVHYQPAITRGWIETVAACIALQKSR